MIFITFKRNRFPEKKKKGVPEKPAYLWIYIFGWLVMFVFAWEALSVAKHKIGNNFAEKRDFGIFISAANIRSDKLIMCK